MIDSVIVFTQTTVALIFACILGVSGAAIDFEVQDDAMLLTHAKPFGVAFGGIAFANAYNTDHELGHLAQEDILQSLYIPIIGIPSLIFSIDNTQGFTEVWADGIR